MRRELEPGIADGAPDPVTAFPMPVSGETYHRERGQAVRDVDLDLYRERLDAVLRRCGRMRACVHSMQTEMPAGIPQVFAPIVRR